MKTKKEILQWFNERADVLDDYNDLKHLEENIDKSVKWEIINLDGDVFCVVLTKKGWKFSIDLYFTKENECYKIKGF